MLDKQIFTGGDWQVRVPDVKPGGWPFERANTFYPDVDDSAVALIVLQLLKKNAHNKERIEYAIKRGTDWVLAMQSTNGGWAAFDKDNNCPWVTRIPFCDFGEG